MNKKNVTIALDPIEYKLLEKIKEGTNTKSLTRTVVKLIEFYNLNSEKIKQLNSNQETNLDRLIKLEERIDKNLNESISRNEFSYLKENVDLMKTNMDLTKTLLERTEFLQNNFVEKENMQLVLDRLSSLDKLVNLFIQQNTDSDFNTINLEKSSEINSLLRAKEKLSKSK